MQTNRKNTKIFPRFKRDLDYSHKALNMRCDWLEKKVNTKIKYLRRFSENPENAKGNIENMIGMAQVPVGINGPLLVKGSFAKGNFFVPMATTEGALITDYNTGMTIITKSSGASVKILKDVIHISPVFFVETLDQSQKFIILIKKHYKKIKDAAESTTMHGKLIGIEPYLVGRRVILKFIYNTCDAQGLNMINKATNVACRYISDISNRRYYLRSKFSSVKIVSMNNIHNGYGKAIFTECIISRDILKFFGTTPEEIYNYAVSGMLVSIYSGIIGLTAHIANAIAAIYIACGQDAADVSTSHIGITVCEVTEQKDLYVSLYIPNLLVGTVGGGTGLSTQKECLEIMECYGKGKSGKFAEIIAASCLAGEISVLIALVTGAYVDAHERLGRNKVLR
jgi:hydroxymethylglutaryl-CoA reductase (NADPH)